MSLFIFFKPDITNTIDKLLRSRTWPFWLEHVADIVFNEMLVIHDEKNIWYDTLYRNHIFMIDEMFLWNASKFVIILGYENCRNFYLLYFHAALFLFPWMSIRFCWNIPSSINFLFQSKVYNVIIYYSLHSSATYWLIFLTEQNSFVQIVWI